MSFRRLAKYTLNRAACVTISWICLSLTACAPESTHVGEKQAAPPPAALVTDDDWQTVSALRIGFAHQSVGSNILSGIQTIAKDHSAPLLIEQTSAPLSGPGLHHFFIGTNGDAPGKIAAFASAMRDGLGASTDVVALKLCFIDFTDAVDGDKLAHQYIDTLKDLASEFPQTRFVPVTAPLTTVQSGPKAWIKKLIGRDPAGYAENARRAQFNKRLRSTYGSTGLLFDLADIESGHGSFGVEFHGHHVETLNAAWTDDGGHLNDAGQVNVAQAFIKHLANIGHSR